ncbi:MAG: SLC13 family permease [Bacillota bacterium]
MTTEMLLVSGILLLILIAFITEWVRYDLVAVFALFTLAILGLIPEDEIFSGFSNPAVITVAALTMISEALQRTGAVHPLSVWLGKTATSIPVLATLGALSVGVMSGFMNNIAAITLVFPVVMGVCRKNDWPPSKVLIPVAFGSLLGGVTSLMGTPPNLLASSMLREWGQEPMAFFELTPLALPVLAVAGIYFGLVAHRLLPDNRLRTDLTQDFGVTQFLVEAIVPAEGPLAHSLVGDTDLQRDYDATVLGIVHEGHHLTNPTVNNILRPGDVVQIEVPRENLIPLRQATGLEFASPKTIDDILPRDLAEMTDVVVMARSPLVGRTLREVNFRSRYRLHVLAIAHKGQSMTGRLADVRLEGGDMLLLLGIPEAVDQVAEDLNLLLLDREPVVEGRGRVIQVLGLFAAMVIVTATGVLPISLAAVGTVALMVLFGCPRLQRVYRAVPWSVIVLLGSMAGVAVAVEGSGLTHVAVMGITRLVGQNPIAILAALFSISCVTASLMTPPATILIVGPLVLGIAGELGVDPRPLLMMVTLGVSCAFLTPFGHQSNVLVYSAGGYRFADYLRVGLPLCILVMLVALVMVPLLWSF